MYPPPPTPLPDLLPPTEVAFLPALIPLSISVAVEATLLAILKWNRFLPSLGVALLMNLVSGALGSAFLVMMVNLVDPGGVTAVVMLFVSFYLLSIPTEFGVLTLFRKDAPRHNVVAALIVNTVSGALTGALVLPEVLSIY